MRNPHTHRLTDTPDEEDSHVHTQRETGRDRQRGTEREGRRERDRERGTDRETDPQTGDTHTYRRADRHKAGQIE